MENTQRLIDRLFDAALKTPQGRKIYTEKTLPTLRKEKDRNGTNVR